MYRVTEPFNGDLALPISIYQYPSPIPSRTVEAPRTRVCKNRPSLPVNLECHVITSAHFNLFAHEEHAPHLPVDPQENPRLLQDRNEFGDLTKTEVTYRKIVLTEERYLQ